jgi:hypothetical protein
VSLASFLDLRSCSRFPVRFGLSDRSQLPTEFSPAKFWFVRFSRRGAAFLVVDLRARETTPRLCHRWLPAPDSYSFSRSCPSPAIFLSRRWIGSARVSFVPPFKFSDFSFLRAGACRRRNFFARAEFARCRVFPVGFCSLSGLGLDFSSQFSAPSLLFGFLVPRQGFSSVRLSSGLCSCPAEDDRMLMVQVPVLI